MKSNLFKTDIERKKILMLRLSVWVAYRSHESESDSDIELSWANFYSAKSGAG